jgi:flagellar biogenesis protein FliO
MQLQDKLYPLSLYPLVTSSAQSTQSTQSTQDSGQMCHVCKLFFPPMYLFKRLNMLFEFMVLP